ncbi:MAG: EVE domain-containing protein [Verrucomicrobiota bacterium JB022]|nr:EVE domain-containing protein [Verrucomicrobiota bacterium JB022]
MKSEPDVFSLDDLKAKPGGKSGWDGVRNYQARNFMRDEMKQGDRVLFYHSSTQPPGVAGLAEIVSKEAYPDPSQFDAKSDYHDPKATQEKPRWMQVDVAYRAHLPEFVTLEQIKADEELKEMLVAQRGQRLSIQPVEPAHFQRICEMAGLSADQVEAVYTQ